MVEMRCVGIAEHAQRPSSARLLDVTPDLQRRCLGKRHDHAGPVGVAEASPLEALEQAGHDRVARPRVGVPVHPLDHHPVLVEEALLRRENRIVVGQHALGEVVVAFVEAGLVRHDVVEARGLGPAQDIERGEEAGGDSGHRHVPVAVDDPVVGRVGIPRLSRSQLDLAEHLAGRRARRLAERNGRGKDQCRRHARHRGSPGK